MRADKIQIVIKRVGERALIQTVDFNYETFSKLVGGFIETVPFLFSSPLLLVCNEEGKLQDLPPNILLHDDVICGDVFVTKFDGVEDFTSLTDIEALKVSLKLNHLSVASDFERSASGIKLNEAFEQAIAYIEKAVHHYKM